MARAPSSTISGCSANPVGRDHNISLIPRHWLVLSGHCFSPLQSGKRRLVANPHVHVNGAPLSFPNPYIKTRRDIEGFRHIDASSRVSLPLLSQ